MSVKHGSRQALATSLPGKVASRANDWTAPRE